MDRDERPGFIPDRESFQDGVEIDLKIGQLAKTAETLTYSHSELLRCFSRVCTSAWNGGTENKANKENWTCVYPITLFRQAFPIQIWLVFQVWTEHMKPKLCFRNLMDLRVLDLKRYSRFWWLFVMLSESKAWQNSYTDRPRSSSGL